MNGAAIIYADALYDLARDEGLTEQIYPQLSQTERLFSENPDYYRLLSAANVPKSERLRVLEEAFSGRGHPYLLSFLKLLCERGQIRALPECFRRFHQRRCEDLGILEVQVATAVPMNADQAKRLNLRLRELTGKRVELRCLVDPAVLGGVRLEYDGKELDGTVLRRLDGLKKTLSDTVL